MLQKELMAGFYWKRMGWLERTNKALHRLNFSKSRTYNGPYCWSCKPPEAQLVCPISWNHTYGYRRFKCVKCDHIRSQSGAFAEISF